MDEISNNMIEMRITRGWGEYLFLYDFKLFFLKFVNTTIKKNTQQRVKTQSSNINICKAN